MNLKEYLGDKQFKEIKSVFSEDNIYAVPKLKKIVINMGIRDLGLDKTKLAEVVKQVTDITGQKPALRKTKQAVSAFDVKENQIVGLQVTLRGGRMYDFLRKLVSIILPSWKSFKGVPRESITPQGDLTIGLSQGVIFPEIDYEKVEATNGLAATLNTTANDKESSLILFQMLGIIFESTEAKKLREESAKRRREERQAIADKKKAYMQMAKVEASDDEETSKEEDKKE